MDSQLIFYIVILSVLFILIILSSSRSRDIIFRRTTHFPFNVVKKNTIKDADVCPICYEKLNDDEFNDKVYLTKCHHMYHKNCIIQWINSNNTLSFNCPLCQELMHNNV